MVIRKNITLLESEYSTIQEYCKKIGVSFSEMMREAALKAIQKSEEISLLEFLNNNCSYVDEDEQIEIGHKLSELNLKDESGVEITLDELL